MAKFRGQRNAFGKPGISPSWTHGDKDGVGTAYAASSRVWFTLWNGILTEVYYPYVDRPQTRDLQFLVTDGKSFFHEERRHLHSRTETIPPALGYRVTNTDPEGRYMIEKEIITKRPLVTLNGVLAYNGGLLLCGAGSAAYDAAARGWKQSHNGAWEESR